MSITTSEPVFQPVGVRPVRIAGLPRKRSMRVLVLPDLHIPAAPAQNRLLLESRSFLEEHDWVVLLGDVTAHYGTVGEYGHVRRFIGDLGRPYSVVNGNHEFFFQPAEEDSGAYGQQWVAGPPHVRRELFRRFERFYGLDSRFEAGTANGVGFCLLGIDAIGPDDQGQLDDEHTTWFADALRRFEDRPLVVFSHFPLCDARLDSIRYYQAGRKPYLLPSREVRELLARRTSTTFWFSGHVHFRPMHPLAQPYLTDDGVWQVHCPDARGYGRADNQEWAPQRYDGLFVRSVTLDGDPRSSRRLTVVTTDLQTREVVASHDFALPPAVKAPATAASATPAKAMAAARSA
jgi:3',5'-cyclic AMP phosphodiesterase CpdA